MDKLLNKYFGIEAKKIKKLDGYDNQNFLVETSRKKYILKTYSNITILPILEAEIKILNSINLNSLIDFPKPIKMIDGGWIKEVKWKENKILLHLLSFVKGTFLGEIKITEKTAYSLGLLLARLDKKLITIQNPIIENRNWDWKMNTSILRTKINSIDDFKKQSLVRYFIQQYEQNVTPLNGELRKSIIHNDANEWNLLIQKNKLTGIIDFGDMAYSDLIDELAIGIVYLCYGQKNYLFWAEKLISSYNSILPLKELELKVLYYKISLRLCLSVCNSAVSKQKNPSNKYLTISEKKAWNMLTGWIKINPIRAENSFRKAINLRPLYSSALSSKLKERKLFFSSSLSLSYKNPIYLYKAAFQYLYDKSGNTFLDAYNNIPHVGHSHPNVVSSAQNQMSKLNTNTRYIYDSLSDYASKLLNKFPKSLSKVFFVNSGSEASDLAIRISRWYTKKNKIMVMEQGYHGNTQLGIEISDYKFNNPKGIGQKSHIIKIPLPKPTKNMVLKNEKIEGLDNQIKKNYGKVSAFISETILGCAGQHELPINYLKNVYKKIRNQGGVCIADEVQTGFGRTGNKFWAYENQDVIPDIVILGKPMANGHPMGAVITKKAIADSFGEGVEFFSSFGGNPVSCEIANTVLTIIDKEDLQLNAKKIGAYYKKRLSNLKSKFHTIGQIRGNGFFLGIEIIDFKGNPNTVLAQKLKNELRNNYVLVGTDGPMNNIIKTKPPMCFTKENVDQVIHLIDKILNEYSS
ncbi:MAG: aminotransferase class III [Flavobacteriaceae bacterium]|nr:aminotransferase class III [Flavobacteriaceae bacterium]|tara:strand:+ start:45058 stop:47298 length:2241 start_codon:yes stop_codon:yes gene_type:complete